MRKEDVPQADDLQYRDYLVSVLDLSVTKPMMPGVGIDPVPPPIQNIHQQTLLNLKKKFKQDFDTTDNSVVGANHVAIEVLRAVLAEDLGFSAADIPAQGTTSEREYLDSLTASSRQTVDALGTTYRIDLRRLDQDETTRIRENILTLQKYLRDDKFGDAGNPFFLYKEEWRLRFLTTFFPENHYAFKKGLFDTSADRDKAAALINSVTTHKNYGSLSRESEFVARLKTLLSLDNNLTEGHRQFTAAEYGLAHSYYNLAGSDAAQLIAQMSMHIVAISADGNQIDDYYTVPASDSAEGFRSSLYCQKQGWYQFGRRPDFFASPVWHDWIDANLGQHSGAWETGLQDGFQDAVWELIDPAHGKIPSTFPFTLTLLTNLAGRYDGRKTAHIDSLSSLDDLEASNTVKVKKPVDPSAAYPELVTALLALHDDLISLVPHVVFLMLPVCQSDVYAKMGDFSVAANYCAQAAREQLLRASLGTNTPDTRTPSESAGDLPWSWTFPTPLVGLNGRDYPYLNHDCEEPFLLLRLGALYLAWADQLYRTDQEPEVYRARELYKAVSRQYGREPVPGAGLEPLPVKVAHRPMGVFRAFQGQLIQETAKVSSPQATARELDQPGFRQGQIQAPAANLAREVSAMSPAARAAWDPLIVANLSPVTMAQPDVDFAGPFLSGAYIVTGFFVPKTNPAILAQQMRARIGITQIDAGLNYFGYSYNLVPVLRYRPLADAAQHFAILAKQAQTDFLTFKEKAENAELALMQARNAVAISAIRVQIESQRILEAQDQEQIASIQVQQVNDAIAAKKAEIADHNSLCGEVKDFFNGIKEFFGLVPDKATSFIGSGYSSAFGFESGGSGAAAGLGVAGGIVLFSVAAGVSMSGMADSANSRLSQLEKLQSQQLPMAKAGLDARQREFLIAQWQKVVATLEAETAQEVLRYSFLRTLNADTWAQMAGAMQSVLRRYLDLGSMAGWLAERALSYAQDRDVRLIRFDYFQQNPSALGADSLQLDLASLEKEYLTGLEQTAPIKWTVSLARDYPLQFGQLKVKNSCLFMTDDTLLNLAYPGYFNQRVRAVEIGAILPITEPPPRGLLSNPGVSHLAGSRMGDEQTIMRSPDVFPLSEFKLKEDMAIYQLPGETLMPFEGSGVNTLWRLELPTAANPSGLASLADIYITFYLQARFSAARKAELAQAGTPTLTRSVLFSAKSLFPGSLKTFLAGGTSTGLEFAVTGNMLLAAEKDRQITNIAIFFMGSELPYGIKGKLASNDHPKGVKFTANAGLAHSNNVPPPTVIPAPPAELNKIATGTPEQTWLLTVPTAGNPNLDRNTITDVLLGLEYTTGPA